jgi:hypothetical protein
MLMVFSLFTLADQVPTLRARHLVPCADLTVLGQKSPGEFSFGEFCLALYTCM